MFFIVGIDSGSENIGLRKCTFFPCCNRYGTMAAVTCSYQVFTLFFIPLFRFGKRYFVTCPQCGTVYELSREEGRRIARDPGAEINPSQMYALRNFNNAYGKTCPNCHAAVDPNAHFCSNCGTKLN